MQKGILLLEQRTATDNLRTLACRQNTQFNSEANVNKWQPHCPTMSRLKNVAAQSTMVITESQTCINKRSVNKVK